MPDEPGTADGNNGGAATPITPIAPPAPPAPTLTQEEVDKLVGRRTAEASRTAQKALLEELGFAKPEDLKALVSRARDADKAAMTETERLAVEAKDARDAAVLDRNAAAAERHSLKVERALANAGVQGDVSMFAKLVDAEVGADDAAVTAAVDGLKAKAPQLFGTAPRGTPSPSEPAGGGQPTRSPTPTDPLARGAERAKQFEAGVRSGFQ